MAVHVPSISGLPARVRAREVSERRDAVRTALVHVLPMLIAITPYGMVIGVTVGETSVNDAAGWSGSVIMFSGAPHLAAVSMLGAGAGALAVLATVVAINARLAIYSASLARSFRDQPRWFRWVAPYFLLDQTYAMVSMRFAEQRSSEWIRWYWVGLGTAILAVWPTAMAFGVIAGPVLPASWQLGFAAPALMAGLLVPALVSRAAIVAAGTAALVAIFAATLPNGVGLLAGGTAGTVVGIAYERIGK